MFYVRPTGYYTEKFLLIWLCDTWKITTSNTNNSINSRNAGREGKSENLYNQRRVKIVELDVSSERRPRVFCHEWECTRRTKNCLVIMKREYFLFLIFCLLFCRLPIFIVSVSRRTWDIFFSPKNKINRIFFHLAQMHTWHTFTWNWSFFSAFFFVLFAKFFVRERCKGSERLFRSIFLFDRTMMFVSCFFFLLEMKTLPFGNFRFKNDRFTVLFFHLPSNMIFTLEQSRTIGVNQMNVWVNTSPRLSKLTFFSLVYSGVHTKPNNRETPPHICINHVNHA